MQEERGFDQRRFSSRSAAVAQRLIYRACKPLATCTARWQAKLPALVTEKLQGGEDGRLTDDQHHDPFEEIDLVCLHRR